MQNSPHYVISFFGIIRAGGVVVNLNPMFKALELEPIIEKTGFKTVITQYTLCPEFLKTSNAGLVRTVIVARFANFLGDHPLYDPPPEARGLTKNFPGTIDFKEMMTAGQPIPVCRIENMDTDLAMLELTGGTTGVPKAAMISVRSFSLAVAVCCNWYRLTPTDTSLGVAPFFHIMGLQVTMVPCLVAGCRLLVMTRFVPQTIAWAIAEQGCTVWVAAPTMLTALVHTPSVEAFDFYSLRIIVTGGSPVPLSLQQRFQKLAPNSQLGEGYGMTEILAAGGVHTPLAAGKRDFAGYP